MKCTRSNADGRICRKKQVLLYLCSLLLTLSYAPEPNPGPRPMKFPCAVCNKAVKWSTPGGCCDSCDVWVHQECMGMPDVVYYGLINISWYCCQCGLPNISPSIFDSTIYESSNSFTRVATNSRGAPFYCLVADCTWEFYWPWTRVWFRGI
jgi:hypothetical protein